MSYSKFKTVNQVQQQFSIKHKEELFVTPHDVVPSELFLNDLKFTREHIDVYASEAARSELIICPILIQLYKRYHELYSFWVQQPLIYDEMLSGVPDYLISKRSPLGKKVFESPFVVIIEAKKSDFELGWGQCLAELVAAKKLNGELKIPVYGIVTDGVLWSFGKLTDNMFLQDPKSYTTDDTAELFGAIDYVLYTAGKHINALSAPPQPEPS